MRRERVLRVAVTGALATFPLVVTGMPGAAASTGLTVRPAGVSAPLVAAGQQIPASLRAGTAPAGHGTGRFPHPTRTTSRYFPLRPGTQYVYDGTVTDAEGSHPHRVIFTVTDLVKKVGGHTSRVIWDRDINDGELTEAELAFMAQDARGNVWTMGEYPEEYENGEFAGAPSTWISGVAGATAGILVPGHPRVGSPAFVQGRAPAIDFYDVGQVKKVGQRVCVPVGCFSHVLVVDEWSPLAPEDGHQLKYYAPKVGLIRIDATGGDSREVLRLTAIHHLNARGMARARAAALRLDRHGYSVSAVYRTTPRAWFPRRRHGH